MCDSFVFYKSFYDSIEELAEDTRLAFLEAIIRYALYDEEPQISGFAKALFTACKPQVDANKKRRQNGNLGAEYGKLGGRPKKNADGDNRKTPMGLSNKNPNGVILETPNVNVNVNENVNVNANGNVNENENDYAFPTESPQEKGDSVSQREVVERIVERWNTLPDCIPKVKAIDMKTERFKMLKERLKTYSEEDVMSAIDNIETSPFLLGDNKSRWVIKFDWFVRPNNFPKVYEGQYNTGKTTVFSQPKIARGISIVDEMIARGELRND